MDVRAMGRESMSGLKGKVGYRVAGPLARRTGWDEEIIGAMLGWALLAFSLYKTVKLLVKVVMAGRTGEVTTG